MDFERSLGLFFEPGLQAWARGQEWLLTFANWMYVNSHFVVTTTFLIWLYIARNHAFYYVRNMFMVAMGSRSRGYLAYPTAPPRFLPEWGFTDTVATFVGEGAENSANVLYNPFAAVPSMHVAFALMIAIPAFFLVRNRVLKALLGGLPRGCHVRRDGHGQPLLDGRRARRDGGRGRPPPPPPTLSPAPAPRPGAGAPRAPESPRERRLEQRTRRERAQRPQRPDDGRARCACSRATA